MVRKANTIQKNFIVTSENVSVQCKNIMNSLPLLFFAFFVGIMTFLLALGLTGYANALICTASSFQQSATESRFLQSGSLSAYTAL